MIKHRYTKACPECQGSGTAVYERSVRASASNPDGYLEEYEDDCENCGGEGVIDCYPEDEDDRGDWLMHERKDREDDWEQGNKLA